MKQTVIYSFDAQKIFLYGTTKIKEKVISLSKEMTKLARSSNEGESADVDRRRDCLLFNQIRKEFGEDYPINEHIIQIDFSSAKESIYDKLREHRNGIELDLGKGKTTFILFLRSASMSRKSRTYYIDKDISERINKRVCLGLIDNKTNTILSKWYAYSGLCISDCDILPDVRLESKNVVVVPDVTKTEKTNCLTAISEPYVIKLIKDIIKKHKCSENDYQTLVHNLMAIMASKEYKELKAKDPSAKRMISYFETAKEVIKKDMKDKDKLTELIEQYYKEQENNKDPIKWYKVNVNDFILSTSLFDGEGLCSGDFAKVLLEGFSKIKGKKEKSGSFQFRLPFVKGVIHSCNLQKFFKDKNITTIEGLTFNDKDLPQTKKYDVKDVKVILTESQFKLEKYISNLPSKDGEDKIDAYFRIINEYEYGFGICNIDLKQNKRVDLNYEVLSTMPLSNGVIRKIIKQNKNSISISMSNDNSLFSRYEDKEGNPIDFYKDKYDLSKNVPDFYRTTELYKKDKENYRNSLKNDCFSGHIQVNGQRKFLSGDLLDLLYRVSGLEMPEEQELGKYEYFVIPCNKEKKSDLSTAVLLRNPHYARNEIALLKPHIKDDDERSIYFSRLRGTVLINATSLTAERLSGADYDGDQVILVNQREIVDCLKKKMFVVDETKEIPVLAKYNLIVIPGLAAENHQFNFENNVKCLKDTFYNQIGLISNSAFYKTFESYKDKSQYDDVAFYTILGGLAIDCAKTGLKPDLDQYLVKKDKGSFGSLFLEGIKQNKNNAFDDSYIKALEQKSDDSLLAKITRAFVEKDDEGKDKTKNIVIKPKFDKKVCPELVKCIAEYYFWFRKNNDRNPFSDGDKIVTAKENLLSLIKENYDINDQDDLDAILEAFRTAGPFNIFNMYCDEDEDSKYHFIGNNKRNDSNSVALRKNYIRERLQLKKPEARYLKYVTRFSNDGYKTLYLILRYWSDYAKFDFTSRIFLEEYCKGLGIDSYIRKTCQDLEIDENKVLDGFYQDIINDYSLISAFGLSDYHLSKDDEKECKNFLGQLIINRIPEKATINNFVAIDEKILNNFILLPLYKDSLIKHLSKGDE